jgi:pimeloyl-ACP methyl ester carboxylesterase
MLPEALLVRTPHGSLVSSMPPYKCLIVPWSKMKLNRRNLSLSQFNGGMYLNPRMVGSGERTLVLSHGYGASQAVWDKVLPHLSRRNKVCI